VDRFAAIADVHGNRWALEAVLEDISRQGVRHIVNAGDHLFGPLDPAGTADLLIGLNLQSVSGNQDRELVNGSPAGHAELSVPHREWLASLPVQREVAEGILMFHGTPAHDDVYLLEAVRDGGVVSLATATEIAARLGVVSQTLLICGHTHIPRTVEVSGHLIVNPGSVGLQAYADDLPTPHRMETGSNHARYAILERGENGRSENAWRVELRAINYDFESAARTADQNGRADWAWRLRTGRAA
jgi:putative phosphoesterase